MKIKKLTLLAAMGAVVVLLAGSLQAAPPTVLLTGGGIVQNNDSGLGVLTSVGGFVAIAKGASAVGANGATVWNDVKGRIQAKLVDAANPTQNLSTLHGKVVCIALLITGDYEVRFIVTRSSGDFPVPVGAHGSLFVFDDGLPSAGGTDMADENFDPAEFNNPVCDTVGGSAHEPLVAGNFTVH